MHNFLVRILTPATTGLTRAAIADQVAERYPAQAEYVRRHMDEHPGDWPKVVSVFTDEDIYAYGEEHRPPVVTQEMLDWWTDDGNPYGVGRLIISNTAALK